MKWCVLQHADTLCGYVHDGRHEDVHDLDPSNVHIPSNDIASAQASAHVDERHSYPIFNSTAFGKAGSHSISSHAAVIVSSHRMS